jgi:hypothetical protein
VNGTHRSPQPVSCFQEVWLPTVRHCHLQTHKRHTDSWLCRHHLQVAHSKYVRVLLLAVCQRHEHFLLEAVHSFIASVVVGKRYTKTPAVGLKVRLTLEKLLYEKDHVVHRDGSEVGRRRGKPFLQVKNLIDKQPSTTIETRNPLPSFYDFPFRQFPLLQERQREMDRLVIVVSGSFGNLECRQQAMHHCCSAAGSSIPRHVALQRVFCRRHLIPTVGLWLASFCGRPLSQCK